MKKIIINILAGRDNLSNGLIALAIVGFIALGWACPNPGKHFSHWPAGVKRWIQPFAPSLT